MNTTFRALMGACALAALATGATSETITVATVNNGDMIRMQGLMDDFYAKHPDIEVEWVTLEENVLRQRVTQDVATKGGQFDVMTIGTYEVPIWGERGWLVSLNDLPESYDVDDLLPAIREGLTVDGELYAAPFYGESSMVMYRTDLMEKAGLEMPDAPTWTFIKEAAAAMTDKDNEVYGICLRGKAGWGENMAFLSAMANSYGAKWFDMDWKPQFDSEAWANTLNDYLELMNNYGPPGASGNGFMHESFMDEMCHAAGADPLQERLRLCWHDASRKVLEAVGEMSEWGSDLGPNRGRGLAFTLAFGVPVAEVVEVTNTPDGIRIDKVFVAADVGRVLDPVNFEAQLQGGVIFGLGHAMNCELTYRDGVAEQDNYHAYEGMRLHQTPQIMVRGLENGDKIRGIGEPAVPPAAPALANAIFAATGQRIRELPLSKSIDFV